MHRDREKKYTTEEDEEEEEEALRNNLPKHKHNLQPSRNSTPKQILK